MRAAVKVAVIAIVRTMSKLWNSFRRQTNPKTT